MFTLYDSSITYESSILKPPKVDCFLFPLSSHRVVYYIILQVLPLLYCVLLCSNKQTSNHVEKKISKKKRKKITRTRRDQPSLQRSFGGSGAARGASRFARQQPRDLAKPLGFAAETRQSGGWSLRPRVNRHVHHLPDTW